MIINVVAFRESATKNVHHLVAYLETRIFNSHRNTVIGSSGTEGQQMTARFQHSQALAPNVRLACDAISAIPIFPHE